MSIAENYKHLRQKIPDNVTIVLAVKKKTPEELMEAIEAGAMYIRENYVQEAGQMYSVLRRKAAQVKWHMIGHLHPIS
jgi:hypothetical protein